MGAESGLPFNSAIRCYKNDTLHTPETPDVIPGMVTVAMPVPSQVSVQDEIQLPSQEAVHQSAMRYFEEVHSIYWLYSSEKFYSKLEETYRMPHQKLTASWSCSLYSILAIANNGSPYPDGPQYNASPNEYLLCAKSLILSVCDEGSLDSVKAMILLATAMQSHGFSNAAYLYSGLAVQIACSMGLHCDKYCISYGGVEKEHARRTWWALFMFDQDLSLRLGRPSAIEDSSNPPLPSERASRTHLYHFFSHPTCLLTYILQILPSGPYSPPSYLASYVTLCKLARNVRSELYKSPTLLGQQLKMKIVDGVMTALQDWADTLPPHLNFSAPAAPFFRRPIAALHLKYHSIQLLICRPFLFYSLLCRKQSPGSAKLQGAEKFSAICLDSSERMLGILQTMVADGLHSRQIALDFYYALDILQVFLSEFAVTKAEKQLESIRQSMKVLQSIGSAGCGEKMISEVHFQLMEWGVLSNSSNTLDSLQGLDTLFPALHSVSDFYDLGISIDDAPNAMFPDIDTSTDLVGEAMMRDILQGPVQ
ncbi:hypothetical protein N7517_006865 [Penicillium concentricum]|uniref:Xylanolytic transcriptional activator regulatory domain-containing protein n=1 Tax=Penicillium concentricum TaxID=293559 RepID=A0A9W9VBR5_9EURO|nr:uncharacterized protein N7517_006865 [Penicillium concentricum]KAJ5374859.1 hypothetical protein N7517_006865 [Penicillium concentricum]